MAGTGKTREGWKGGGQRRSVAATEGWASVHHDPFAASLQQSTDSINRLNIRQPTMVTESNEHQQQQPAAQRGTKWGACAYSTCSGPPRPDGWTGSADGGVCMCLHRIIKKKSWGPSIHPSIHPAGRHVYFCFFFGRERCFFCGAAEGSKVGR